jgi:hypothetical protein
MAVPTFPDPPEREILTLQPGQTVALGTRGFATGCHPAAKLRQIGVNTFPLRQVGAAVLLGLSSLEDF